MHKLLIVAIIIAGIILPAIINGCNECENTNYIYWTLSNDVHQTIDSTNDLTRWVNEHKKAKIHSVSWGGGGQAWIILYDNEEK